MKPSDLDKLLSHDYMAKEILKIHAMIKRNVEDPTL
jgi:hypothetical protein